MNTANFYDHRHASLAQNVKAVLTLQAAATIVALVIAGTVAMIVELPMVALLKATVYGCLLAIVSTWLSARSVRRATELKHSTDESSPLQQPVSLVPVFSGLLNKLVIVGGGIGFGLIALQLSPIAVIAAYIWVQFAGAAQLLRFNRELQQTQQTKLS